MGKNPNPKLTKTSHIHRLNVLFDVVLWKLGLSSLWD